MSTSSSSLWTEVLLFRLASMTHACHTLACTYGVKVYSQLVHGDHVLALKSVACISPPLAVE